MVSEDDFSRLKASAIAMFGIECDGFACDKTVEGIGEHGVADKAEKMGWRKHPTLQGFVLCPACLKAMKGGEDAGS